MVHTERNDGMLEIVLDSPRGNMLSMDDIRLLSQYVEAACEDNGVGGILITGKGAAFCAGLSADSLEEMGAERLFTEFDDLLRRLFVFPKPVVAAVNGHSVGGGLLLQSTADYCVIARHPRTKLGLPEVKLGLVIDRTMFALLSFHAKSSKALQAMLLGSGFYSSEEACEMGFGDAAVEPGDLMRVAREKLFEMASFPRQAYRATKDLVKREVL